MKATNLKYSFWALVFLLIFFSSCSTCRTKNIVKEKDASLTLSIPSSNLPYLSFNLHGQITDFKGRPIRGMKIISETKFLTSRTKTGLNGFYSININQGAEESSKFTFINAIGDKVYFQRQFLGQNPTRLNFKIDDKGSLLAVD